MRNNSPVFFILAGAVLLASALFAPMPALASAQDTGRFFIHSQSGLLKAIFGVQHEFNDGFTADAVYGKRAFLNFLAARWGIKVQPVPAFNIQDLTIPDVPDLNAVDDFINGPKPLPSAPPRPTPKDSVAWGVRFTANVAGTSLPNGGKGVTVAILDTGADTDHPDLKRRIAGPPTGPLRQSSSEASEAGCFDFTHGAPPAATCVDANGHGTHLAGIVAADNGADKLGIFGVAPQARLIILKVCSAAGMCLADDVAAGLKYLAAAPAQVGLLGFNGPAQDLVTAGLADAAANGALLIAPAGNSAADAPANSLANAPAVVAVSAFDRTGAVLKGSVLTQTGFFAPGVDIESTWQDDGYHTLSGTSAAAAHIAGLAAKLWAGSADTTLKALADFNPALLPPMPLVR